MYKFKTPLSLTLTYEQTNDELRTNTMNTTNAIRLNIFARSCNDDYSPVMEAKLRLLSLVADPKMEAYDAKLEKFFYEEKDVAEDNEKDRKNQETFVDNDETDYEAEVNNFNERYGTCFSVEQLDIFNEYINRNCLRVTDGIDYCQSCHNCGKYLKDFCGEYCRGRCADYVEDFRYPCFRGEDCLICYGYPKTTCYWERNGCDRCDAYDGPEEDRYPYSCAHCLSKMTDHEGYDIDNDLYCNDCAADLFDKTGHLEEESRKRYREAEEEEIASVKSCDLQEESYDIWELALDINGGDKEAALDMIEDQERLRAHPRIIEYYRAKECSSECSSKCSSLDEDLQERKKARHTRFESVDLDVSDAEEDDACAEEMVIDLLNDDESHVDAEEMVIDLVSQDDSEEEDEPVEKGVMMPETSMRQMVSMIQDLRDENDALRHELELLRGQRRMIFPEGASINFTDEDGQRYLNIHAASPYASAQSPLTMADLEGDLEANSDDSDYYDYDFEMNNDM